MRLPTESLHVQLCCPEIMKQYVAVLLHQVDLLSFFYALEIGRKSRNRGTISSFPSSFH